MLSKARRSFIWCMRHGFALLFAFIALGLGMSLLRPGPAQADEEADTLKAVALSDVSLSQRLMALNALKKKGGTAATDALAAIAADGDLRVATAACAQLGRLGTTGSKAKLKSLLENASLSDEARIAAASSIAEHWKDRGDESYLEDKCEGNDALEAHCAVLMTRVYGEE